MSYRHIPPRPGFKWCPKGEHWVSVKGFYKAGPSRKGRDGLMAYCIECELARKRELHQKRRYELLDAMGGKCVRCGFSDYRALQIDHIEGGGCQEFLTLGTSSYRYYKKVLAHPERYQILCANCNTIKVVENEERPRRRLGMEPFK